MPTLRTAGIPAELTDAYLDRYGVPQDHPLRATTRSLRVNRARLIRWRGWLRSVAAGFDGWCDG